MKLDIICRSAMFVVAMGLPLSGTAANFVNVMRKPTADGMMTAIDSESIIERGDGIVEFWQRDTFKTPQEYSPGPGATPASYFVELLHSKMDCRQRRIYTFAVILRGAKNEILMSDNVVNPKWNDVAPETVRERVMNAICTGRWRPPFGR